MYEKFEQLMKEKGVTPADVSKATGIGKSSLTGWKNGSYTPKADKLYAISKYFGVPMEFFFDDGIVPIKDQADLDAYFDQINDVREKHGKPPIKEKPLFRVAAGNGCYNSQYADETISSTEDGFEFVEIVGDSMLPILEDGDIVKVELTTEVSPHDLSVVKIDGETSCVKYCEITDRGIWLKAENKAVYEDHFYSIQQVLTLPIVVIGRVVELRRKIK